MLRTTPPPEGMGQCANVSVAGSKATSVLGVGTSYSRKETFQSLPPEGPAKAAGADAVAAKKRTQSQRALDMTPSPKRILHFQYTPRPKWEKNAGLTTLCQGASVFSERPAWESPQGGEPFAAECLEKEI